jgi:hypothetical protein
LINSFIKPVSTLKRFWTPDDMILAVPNYMILFLVF